MDFKALKKELEKSVNIHAKILEEQKTIVQKEISELRKLLDFLSPVLPTRDINGQKSTLIYEFEESGKKTISSQIYYCEDGKIRYQVYKKEDYRSYNPAVEYEGSFAVVSAEEMFKTIDLSDIVNFFVERIDALKEIAKKLHESNEIRKNFLDSYQRVLKRLI